MPWEEIGVCGGDGKAYENEWGPLTLQMGLSYTRFVCGEAPKGCKLGLHWFSFKGTRQHEVALFWNPDVIKRAPRRYIWKCQWVLNIFDETVPWRKLRKEKVKPPRVPTLGEMRDFEIMVEDAHRSVLAAEGQSLNASLSRKSKAS
jgi:hypothetical protein